MGHVELHDAAFVRVEVREMPCGVVSPHDGFEDGMGMGGSNGAEPVVGALVGSVEQEVHVYTLGQLRDAYGRDIHHLLHMLSIIMRKFFSLSIML